MKVVIVDADNSNIKKELNFLWTGFEGEDVGEGGVIEEGKIEFNLLNPFLDSETETPSETIFGYTITLNQLQIDTSFPPDEPPVKQLIEKSCTFNYEDHNKEENFPIYLKIKKNFYDQIEEINNNYEYIVTWKKILKPTVKYTYKKDKENFIYYVEKKEKILFDSTITKATFVKETQILNLTNLDDEKNFFIPESSNLEIIGFKNESFLDKQILQTIPLNSEMIFTDDNDTKKYVFSLVAEEEKEFPLDFFIKNIDVANNENPPSGGGGDGTEEGGTGGDGTEEGV